METNEEVLAFVHDSFVQDYTLDGEQTRPLSWTVDGIGRVWDVATSDALFQFEDGGVESKWRPFTDYDGRKSPPSVADALIALPRSFPADGQQLLIFAFAFDRPSPIPQVKHDDQDEAHSEDGHG